MNRTPVRQAPPLNLDYLHGAAVGAVAYSRESKARGEHRHARAWLLLAEAATEMFLAEKRRRLP